MLLAGLWVAPYSRAINRWKRPDITCKLPIRWARAMLSPPLSCMVSTRDGPSLRSAILRIVSVRSSRAAGAVSRLGRWIRFKRYRDPVSGTGSLGFGGLQATVPDDWVGGRRREPLDECLGNLRVL